MPLITQAAGSHLHGPPDLRPQMRAPDEHLPARVRDSYERDLNDPDRGQQLRRLDGRSIACRGFQSDLLGSSHYDEATPIVRIAVGWRP